MGGSHLCVFDLLLLSIQKIQNIDYGTVNVVLWFVISSNFVFLFKFSLLNHRKVVYRSW